MLLEEAILMGFGLAALLDCLPWPPKRPGCDGRDGALAAGACVLDILFCCCDATLCDDPLTCVTAGRWATADQDCLGA